MPQRLKVELHDESKGVCVIRNEGTGARFLARCEPVKRSASEDQQKNEYRQKTESGKKGKQIMNIETATQVLSYFEKGNVAAGNVVNDAAREFMAENRETDYQKALVGVHRNARAEIDEGFDEFGKRGRSYASHFKIGGSEAIARVQKHDRNMAALYELDPMRATDTIGVQPEPAVADIVVPQPDIPERFPGAVQQIGVMLFALPRDSEGFITLDQAAAALAPYPTLLQQAVSEKLDYYARMGIGVLGLAGVASENYPAGFKWATKRYPSLAALYASGRLTSQALRDLLPQLRITD